MCFAANQRFLLRAIGSQFSHLLQKFILFTLILPAATEIVQADSVVVFNEIMYHPLTNETKFEWLELHNQMAVNVDLSNWSIDGGVHYTFLEGTIIPSRGYLLVALSPADLKVASGQTNVVGPFTGRLSNSGDTLQLFNNNHRLMDEIAYGVDGDWPVGADGAGVSLSKRDEDSASGLAINWTVSPLVGGTPGRRNFAISPVEITNSTPVLIESSWRFNTAGASSDSAWTQFNFDDSTWTSGQGIFQTGNVIPPSGAPENIPSIFSTGINDKRTVSAPGSPDLHYQLTQSAQTTTPPPPLPATVIENHPAWLANDTASSWIGVLNPGSLNVAAGAYNYQTTFSLDGFDPTSVALKINMASDNRVTDVRINGVSLELSYVGFNSLSGDFNITNGFHSGSNTLDFLTFNDSTSANPAGFRARVTGIGRRQFPVHTFLPTGSASYRFRTEFSIPGQPSQTALQLDSVVADGAVFYLNGTEVLRINMPSGPITPQTAALSTITNPPYAGPFTLPGNSLIAGANVLAVEVHQGPGGSKSLLFGADLLVITTNVLVPPPMTLALNEISAATNSDFSIELMNYGSFALNLEGCVLVQRGSSTNGEYIFPAKSLPPNGFLQLNGDILGFSVSGGDLLFLYAPGKASVLDGVVMKSKARGRLPDGTGPWWFPAVATPGSSNSFRLSQDVVINEVMYDPPVQNGSDTWIELYNRGASLVDLSGWRLSKDVVFDFPAGTTIPSDGYLVIAKDAGSMGTNYPGIAIAGSFTGNLKHKGGHLLLTDAIGNPANELIYFDGKPWPDYASGGGSSLELRDPGADNSKPESWAASIETARSNWSNYTYRAVAQNLIGPTLWNEFVMGLLDSGECLIDDLSVIESPSGTPIQLLQNGNFETGLTAWRLLGSHSQSRIEIDPDNSANHVLHLISTAATGHIHDHLETTYASGRTVTDGKEYQISFRGKWLAGNNRLNTRLYFNRVAKTSALPMPSIHGTPGRRNSTYISNSGPTFRGLIHSPIVPKSSDPVSINVSARDPQGIRDVTLWWSLNGAAWKTVPMMPGSLKDSSNYTGYTTILPSQPTGSIIQFFVQAADNLGAISFYPAGGTNSRALYKVDDNSAIMPQLNRFRLLMTAKDAQQLHALTNVMSSDLKGATVVYNDQQVFYDAGIHLQSSERGRSDTERVGFSLKFHPDALFRGVQNTVTLDRSGGYSGRTGKQGEILLWQAVNHAGGIFGLDCDLVQVLAPRSQENSPAMMRMSAFDGDYWDNQFRNGGNGNMYTLELIYYPLTTATGSPQAPKLPQPDDVINVEMKNWGDNQEYYRWILLQENHADADDYSQIIALNKAFSLSGSALETQTSQLMDSDEWMRTLAFKAFTGDGDTFTYGLNHNWKIYFRPEDGKALGVLWDMDFAFAQSVDYAFPGSGSANTYKITLLPNNYRRFYNHLLDIMTTTVNSKYLGPWAAHYSGLLGQDWSSAVSYLQQRAAFIRAKIPLSTPFAITSNGGKDFSSATNLIVLAGTAPLTIKEIQVNSLNYPIRWTSLTNWSLTIRLPAYTNLLAVQGIDNYGKGLTNALVSIVVTNLGSIALQPVVINEWMADNAAPGGFIDPADGHYSDWIELYNPNPSPVNLSGYFLSDALAQPRKWMIPTNTALAANSFLLIWADGQTNLNGSGSADLHANFKLSKTGSTLALFNPDGTVQHIVNFGLQTANVSQGFLPDGNTNSMIFMDNWTPGSANKGDAPDSPNIGFFAIQSDGSISLLATVISGRTYQVQFKNNLNDATWTPLGNNRTASGKTITVVDPVSDEQERFYRVILLQ
ncbi:MAG: CotH protein [Verrucomicrobiales bacterium]|nr:CotH protein [Verrucomicrobiales bacterium]